MPHGRLSGSAGFARVVVPGGSAGGRYVSSLASLTVFDGTAAPEPASLALLLAGLARPGCCGGRARRAGIIQRSAGPGCARPRPLPRRREPGRFGTGEARPG